MSWVLRYTRRKIQAFPKSQPAKLWTEIPTNRILRASACRLISPLIRRKHATCIPAEFTELPVVSFNGIAPQRLARQS